MTPEQKAKFVLALHKHSLQALDSGGGVIGGGGSGGVISDISSPLTVQNTYQAQAPTSAATVGSQQATLAGELGTEAAGGGPNPAQVQYQQNIQAIAGGQAQTNAANRALNPAAAARLSGQQATQLGQGAAATAGIQQAQQQLAAQNEMLGLTGQEQTGALEASGINAQVAQNNANAVNQTAGGILSGIGSGILAAVPHAKGGDVKNPLKMATGGSIQVPGVPNFSNANQLGSNHDQASQAGSSVGKWLQGKMGIAGTSVSGPALAGGAADAGGVSALAPAVMAAAKGGQIKMDPDILIQVPGMASLMKKGGKVSAPTSAQKAVKKDDSLKNDKVPTLLSENEIVLPRSITMHKNAPEMAAKFVSAVLAKRRLHAIG